VREKYYSFAKKVLLSSSEKGVKRETVMTNQTITKVMLSSGGMREVNGYRTKH